MTTQKSLWAARAILGAGLVLGLFSAAAAEVDPDLLAGLEARAIGPAGMSGRIAAIDAVVSDPRIIYVGAAIGGVWKSTNSGLNWTPVFDDQRVSSIGAVAVFQPNPDIVWVGTGEGNPRNSTSVGAGIYKSLDGGNSWSLMGLEKTERIHRIIVHPSDPNIVYVGAMGRAWGENAERGVFKTTDGGKTWRKVLYVDERTGIADLIVDPGNPDKLIAAMWDYRRWPWSFRSGGPGSGIFLSYDGGESWKRLTEEDGLPKGELGRIGLAISHSDPDIVYALIEAKKNALIRSDDGGETWTTVSDEPGIAMRPFYFNDIRVDPQHSDRLYRLTQTVQASDDGGRSFETIAPFSLIHPDHHALWINPEDGDYIIDGNDGGIGISRDRGKTWRFSANLPLAQFYHIAVDNDLPYNVYGGMQDNGSWRGPSEVWENGGIRNHHWSEVAFGDGFDTRPDPTDSMIGYGMSQQGFLVRWNERTGVRKSIRPAAPDADTKLRFNWNAGLAIDPFEPATIYFGSQFVHKSTDRGDNWTIISPDLTTNDPEHQQQAKAGGLSPDVTGAENFTTIVAITPSALEQGLIWVGSDDGRVHVTRDGGATWESIEKRARRVPEGAWVPHIEASPHDPSVAFVVFDDHRRSNWTPYVYRVEDYGKRWVNIASDDIDGFALSIKQDPVDPDLLFLGTEFGLYVSLNGGKAWFKWTHGVPTVPVKDIAIQERESDLVIGTHGRAAYIIDDISPLRGLSDDDMASSLKLMPIGDAQAYSVKQTGASRFPGSGEFRGDNAPYGALISWIMSGEDIPHPDAETERARRIAKRAQGGGEAESEGPPSNGNGKKDEGPEVKIEITNAAGELIRTFTAPAKLGLNRVAWNLRHDGAKRFRDAGPRGAFGPQGGPEVPPGDYRVTLSFKDSSVSGAVTVLADPRLGISAEDRMAKYRAALHLKALQDLAADAGNRIIDVRADIERIVARAGAVVNELEAAGDVADDHPLKVLSKDAKALMKELGEVESKLRTTRETKGIPDRSEIAMGPIGTANRMLNSSWDKPTEAQAAYVADAEAKLKTALDALNAFTAGKLGPLRATADDLGLGLLAVGEPLAMPRN